MSPRCGSTVIPSFGKNARTSNTSGDPEPLLLLAGQPVRRVASGAYRDGSLAWLILLSRRRRWGTLRRKPQPEGRAAAGKVLR
jgi:hypothetical protein